MTFIEKKIVRIVEWLKKVFHVQTYVIEFFFVGIILVVVAIISGKGIVEWIGVVAVMLNFGHASIADRLEEKEAVRFHVNKKSDVECYWKLKYYFIAKELCWLAYFLILGAYSALVGVGIFLLYPWWRKIWRKYHPVSLK